jgi:hypothetical protein
MICQLIECNEEAWDKLVEKKVNNLNVNGAGTVAEVRALSMAAAAGRFQLSGCWGFTSWIAGPEVLT